MKRHPIHAHERSFQLDNQRAQVLGLQPVRELPA